MSGYNKKSGSSVSEFFIGIGMMIAGLTILLMKIHVLSFGFLSFGPISSAPVLLIIFIFLIIWAINRGETLQWILVLADVLCIIISVILGTRLYFERMSVFTLILMLGLFAAGVGLVLKNLSVVRSGSNDR